MAKKLKVEVGSIVAFNNLDDATWFEVLGIDGFRIKVREENTDFKSQFSDISLVKQIRKT